MKYLFLLSLLGLSITAFSQTTDSTFHPPVVSEKIFKVVEQMPEFPGGEEALMRFIRDNITYPAHARDNDIQGRVVVGFVVNEDGSLSDIEIKKSVVAELDKEAMRVIKLFPRFKPGREQGKPVKVSFILPIKFTLAPVIESASSKNDPSIPLPMANRPAKLGDDYIGAEYKYGIDGLVKFLDKENKMPKSTATGATKNYVLLKLSINERGKITDTRVLKSLNPKADAEALRMVHLLKKFRPATYKKQAVTSTFSLPVVFTLAP